MKYGGNKVFVYTFNQKIEVTNWNPDKQRVKSNKQTDSTGDYSLNDLLDTLKNSCEKAYKEALKDGIPEPKILKSSLDKFRNKNDDKKVKKENTVELFELLDMFVNGKISNKGKSKSKNTLQNYATVRGHLNEFEKIQKLSLTYESINLNFFDNYVHYLKNRSKYQTKIKSLFPDRKNNPITDLGINSIAKDITVIKTVMGEAVDRNLTTNIQFKHKKFSVTEEKTYHVALTEDEIIKLYKYDLSKKSNIEGVRDLFVFGCFTGMRYSDYSTIDAENIFERDGDLFIRVIAEKTNEPVVIPCNPVVKAIFKKYEKNLNWLPGTIASQTFNEYIKKACKEAGLIEKGRKFDEPKLELWECVASHTARRSMATNYTLEGVPARILMKITGHKTEKSFNNYIKISEQQAANELLIHIKKKDWSSILMKVA
ncbi:MAG: tyrosine-type recombinase/integrase [Bacteroidetes bacterium]|nr:tyrosine-type recombinase/integrase [Bacteroidota bacterium]